MSVADYSEPSVLRLRIVQPYVPLRWNFKRERVCNRHTGLRRRNTIQKKGRMQEAEKGEYLWHISLFESIIVMHIVC